jgi:hypothetical protein
VISKAPPAQKSQSADESGIRAVSPSFSNDEKYMPKKAPRSENYPTKTGI